MIHKLVPEMAGDAYSTNACHMTGRTPSSLIPLAHFLAVVGFVGGNSERRPATYKGW